MKLSTRRDLLFAQLQTVTRAASTRSAVQALSGVQVLVQGGAIELRATDMEIGFWVSARRGGGGVWGPPMGSGLRVPLAGDVGRERAPAPPARLLVSASRALPGDEVS